VRDLLTPWGVVAIIVAVVACSSNGTSLGTNSGSSSNAPLRTASVSPTATTFPLRTNLASQTPEVLQVLGIGDSSNIDGILVTLAGVRPAPAASTNVIALELTVRIANDSQSDFDLSLSDRTLMRGPDGQDFSPCMAGAGLAKTLRPQETATSELIYCISDESYPLMWIFLDDRGTERARWQILPLVL